MSTPSDRPRASLGRVMDDLGSTLLHLVHGDPEKVTDIGGVVIHDPLDAPALPAQALVLGVGVDAGSGLLEMLGQLGGEEAGAVVVRAPVPATEEVRAAADEAGVVVLGLSRGVPWAHLSTLLRSVLAEGDVGVSEPESLGGLPSGDLFAVANAVASLLNAPVTIEDRSSRVLAFSGRQDEADPGRVETILGRQVPERFARVLEERGVFRELLRSPDPVYIDPIDAGDVRTLPRVAIAVRAGDEVLGSIWAAVDEPLSPERIEALRESSTLVALHLLRVRAGADHQRRVRADLLGSALAGDAGSADALERLGLAGLPLLVVGVALEESGTPDQQLADAGGAEHERQRLADAFAVHLAAMHSRSAVAPVGSVAYGLLPVVGPMEGAEDRAMRLGQDFIYRLEDRLHAYVGVGPVATDLVGLTHSRRSVDRVLRVLREGRGRRRVARLDDVEVASLVMEVRDLAAARGDRPTSSISRLIDYDKAHDSHLVETLRAWLEAFGDVTVASRAQFVHANTFRYRLRRVAEVGGLDLGDPDERFAAMLQLRVLADGS